MSTALKPATAQPATAKAATAQPATGKAAAKPATAGQAGNAGQARTGGNHRDAGPRPDSVGRPLPDPVRRKVAPVVGEQASDAARVHTGQAAEEFAARNDAYAVTVGPDIYFAAGQYRPGTRDGDWVIAHEVAHVAQAQRGVLDRPAFLAVSPTTSTPLEHAADRAADQAVTGEGQQSAEPVPAADERKKDGSPAAPGGPGQVGLAGADGAGAAPGAAAGAGPGAAAGPGVAPGSEAGQGGEAGAGPEAAAEAAPGAEQEPGGAREAAAGPAVPKDLPVMPEPAMDLSPAEGARAGGVQSRAGDATTATTDAPAAADNVSTGQAAVQVPQAENDARAGQKVVEDLVGAPKPSIEVQQLCDRIRRLIKEKRPADEEAVVDTRPALVAKEAGAGVQTGVQQNVDSTKASYGPIDKDPQGPAPPTAPGIDPLPPANQTAPFGATKATPDAVPPEQVSLDGDTAKMADKARDAGLEKDTAKLVNSGPVADARAAQGDLNTLAGDGPSEALKAQQAALAKSDEDMAALQAKAVAALKEARAGHAGGVQSQQHDLKEGSEQRRARLSKEADDAYTDAQSKVLDILKDVPTTAMSKWTAGLPPLTDKFNSDLKVVTDAVTERHDGITGFFVSGWDAVTGLPGWMIRAYDQAEEDFGNGVCTLILDISSYVDGIIKLADGIIEAARARMTEIFTKDLPTEDQEWAAEQLKGFGKKLDALHDKAESTRKSFNKELMENAGDAVQAAREKIQELRKKAQGLWGRFLDAVGRFLDDPVKFIIDGLLSLVGISPPAFWALLDKISQVFDAIVDAPMIFANNLMAGVGQGFQLFFDNIGRHLLQGLLEWLFSGLKDEGISIEIPKEISLRSVVTFALQLLGISWARIRKLLVEQLGEKPVAIMEKAAGIIYTLATRGIEGILDDIKQMLDPQTIIDAILDAAIKYVTETLIVKVAQKIIMMLNPAGAILAAIEAIYRVLKWVFNNAARIFHFIEAVVNGMADVVSGNVGGVAKTVEKALAMLIAPVIDFLADYLGLGGLPGKVANAIKGLHTWVEGIMRSVITWLVEMGRKLLATLGFKQKDDKKDAAPDGKVGEDVAFSGGGESHKLYVDEGADNATLMVASAPMTLKQRLADFSARATGDGGKLPFFSSDVERDRALTLISTLKGKETEADRNADELVREHRKQAGAGSEAKESEAKDRTLVDEERSIGSLLSELYDLFEEHPGDDVLDMRAPYGGSVGSGEISFHRKKETAKTAYVMASGPVAGRVVGANRGKVTAEAEQLTTALKRQKFKDGLDDLGDAISGMGSSAAGGEAAAKRLLSGIKAKPEPAELQAKLDDAAGFARTVAGFALIGGGEIVERAVTALIDDLRAAERSGVFTTVSSIRTEIARLTAAAQLALAQAKRALVEQGKSKGDANKEAMSKVSSTTLFFVPGQGLAPEGDKGAAGATVKYTGAEVSGVASYEELLVAIEKAVADLGPRLVRAVHDVPVAPIKATMEVKLRGKEVSKDQDKFLGELALLLRLEMARTNTAWAFVVPRLVLAKSAAEVAAALAEDVFPNMMDKFVKAYEAWGPAIFDKASEALLDHLGVEIGQKEGLRGGEQVFVNVAQAQTAVTAVKDKLRAVYDEAVKTL
jgi:hypothetical protein